MADGIVNTLVNQTFRLRSGATGETFTATNATKPDGSAWTGLSIVEVGNGTYRLLFTASEIGIHLATITGDTTGEVFEVEYDIQPVDASRYSREAINKALTLLNVR